MDTPIMRAPREGESNAVPVPFVALSIDSDKMGIEDYEWHPGPGKDGRVGQPILTCGKDVAGLSRTSLTAVETKRKDLDAQSKVNTESLSASELDARCAAYLSVRHYGSPGENAAPAEAKMEMLRPIDYSHPGPPPSAVGKLIPARFTAPTQVRQPTFEIPLIFDKNAHDPLAGSTSRTQKASASQLGISGK